MNPYFSLSEKVYDITERYPELIDFLAANGFGKISNPLMRKTIGKQISLEMAFKSRHVDSDAMEKQLVEVIENNANGVSKEVSDTPSHISKEKCAIQIEGILPCPIRLPLMDVFETWRDTHHMDVNFDLQSASMGLDWLQERIEACKDETELADVYLSAGYSLFFDYNVLGKYRDTGIFTDSDRTIPLKEMFDNENISLNDPNHQYTVVGIVPAVFMVNTEALGERPMPESWSDLMKPEYENTIAFPVQDLDMFHALLLGIYSKYGTDGLYRLGQNLMQSMHHAQMVKMGKSKKQKEIPAITVIPYFFACMMQETKGMQLVWPKDGAILNPIFLLAKSSSKEKVQPLIEFILSEEFGKTLSSDGKFPSTNPLVNDCPEKERTFIWPGWDILYHEDIPTLLKQAENAFFHYEGGNS